MKKLAFCFLIYDIINLEELWNIFFHNVDKNKYNIYIHYKYNTPLKYFEQYKIKNCIDTAYSSLSIVKAQNLLIQQALLDEQNTHIIFLSNSCIPLKSFYYIYNHLQEDKSYFNITPQSQCFPRCNKTLDFIDRKCIQKASQWCILSREHALLMINDQHYLKWFDYTGTVPDEHCYITNIFYNNLQSEIIITNNLAEGATTFTNWEGMNYKYASKNELKKYSRIDNDELYHLLESNCFFGRKFVKNSIHSLVNPRYLQAISSCVS